MDKALRLPFRREWPNGKEGDMPTDIMVKWSKHHGGCHYKFAVTDPYLLAELGCACSDGKVRILWLGRDTGEAKGLDQGC